MSDVEYWKELNGVLVADGPLSIRLNVGRTGLPIPRFDGRRPVLAVIRLDVRQRFARHPHFQLHKFRPAKTEFGKSVLELEPSAGLGAAVPNVVVLFVEKENVELDVAVNERQLKAVLDFAKRVDQRQVVRREGGDQLRTEVFDPDSNVNVVAVSDEVALAKIAETSAAAQPKRNVQFVQELCRFGQQ